MGVVEVERSLYDPSTPTLVFFCQSSHVSCSRGKLRIAWYVMPPKTTNLGNNSMWRIRVYYVGFSSMELITIV